MIDGLRKYFAERLAPTAATLPDRRLAVATCALLLEVAQADDELAPGESAAIRALAHERFGVSDAEVDELLALAQEERTRSAGLYGFTRLICDAYDDNGKRALLESLWRVIYSDGRLEEREDALIHRLAQLLGLKHADLIALKLRVKGGTAGDSPPTSDSSPASA